MRLLQDAAARLVGGIGMLLFMAGTALVALGYVMSPLDDLDDPGDLPECSLVKQPVSPVEKKAES